MVQLEVKIAGVDTARTAIGVIGKRARRMKPAMKVVGRQVREGVLQNFRREGWWPSRWRKSKAAARRAGKTLQSPKATLRRSIQATATNDYAEVGTDVRYAAIHQFGGVCGRNHATTLPARPFLPVDARGKLEPGIMERIGRTAEAWIMEGRIVE